MRDLCLTFDDGPASGSTMQIINILDRWNIKAIFFCNGKAAEKYPEIVDAIKSGGHLIGNHGYGHLDGWATSLKRYLNDISLAAPFTSSELFRPPYGHLRLNQYRRIRSSFKIVFWDIMPYDFDDPSGGIDSLRRLKKMIRPGSVIVLHDTPDSCAGSILEEFIGYSNEAGYRFIVPRFREM